MKVKIQFISKEKEEEAVLNLHQENEKKEEIEQYLIHNGITNRTIMVSIDRKQIYLSCNTIYYIEAEQNLRVIHTKEQMYHSSSRLYELEDQLPWYFIRISKSVILNVNYVQKYCPIPNGLMMAELPQGQAVYISRRYLKPLLEKIEIRSEKER